MLNLFQKTSGWGGENDDSCLPVDHSVRRTCYRDQRMSRGHRSILCLEMGISEKNGADYRLAMGKLLQRKATLVKEDRNN